MLNLICCKVNVWSLKASQTHLFFPGGKRAPVGAEQRNLFKFLYCVVTFLSDNRDQPVDLTGALNYLIKKKKASFVNE